MLVIASHAIAPALLLQTLGTALGVFAGLALPFAMALSAHRLAARR